VSFTQLASNKVVKVPAASTIFKEDKLKFYMELLNINLRKTLAEKKYITNTDGSGSVRPATDIEKMQNSIDETMAKCESNTIGMTVNNIRCIFSPSLAELCRKDFACVVIDEATKIKGQETDVGLGVRLMDPPYRLVLSATPIKNRLPDLFWLAWWATGGKAEAHARWPYSREAGEQDKFAQEFLVSERNLSAEARANDGKPLSNNVRGGRQRRGKVTAEVCNIHRLWKLIGPVILRRRKRDIGEDLVEKIRQPVRVPMGTEQARVYEYHLKAGYIDKHGKPAIGAQLQALRSAAAAPHSALLEAQSEDDFDKPYRSKFEYIPKVAACLTVIENVIRKGEQIVIFSAFHEPLDTLARRLKQAGVPFEQLDGRDSQEHRGKIAALFKLGRPKAKPVLLAGVGAMAEGHSWDLANNCALIAYDWAYNLFEQAINRIHRLNSKKVVNVYPIMCLGSVDRKLEALIEEKGNACELVLDGKLLGENIEEVNLAELLQIAAAEFADQKTYPEELLEKEWPALRARLGHAMEVSSYIGVRNGGIRQVPVETAFRMPTFDMSNIPVIRMTREEVRDVVANLSRALHAPMRKISASFW
jgi:SNF2 family DNA or RNA helicase